MENVKCSICGNVTEVTKQEASEGGRRKWYCGLKCLNEGRRREPSLAGLLAKQERMASNGAAYRAKRKG